MTGRENIFPEQLPFLDDQNCFQNRQIIASLVVSVTLILPVKDMKLWNDRAIGVLPLPHSLSPEF
jgi:hypothetical protein